MAHLDKGCETCDAQVEDNEQTFFAGYYKGIGLGVDSERKRIVGILENVQTMFADSVTSPQKELMDGILNQVVTYLIKEISGGKK